MRQRIFLRGYDIILSILILVISAIPLLFLIILKISKDGRPLFFNSKRIGKSREAFKVYKFRTMVNDSRFIANYLIQIASFGFEKIPLDAEVYTKMGRFFERFQIVELLQVFNVLEGNMSIIGYRPLPISHVLQLEEELGIEKIRLRHSVLPGITGISQILGKTTLTNEERVNVENSYNLLIQTKSEGKIMFYNTIIIAETLIQIIFKKKFFINFLKKKILQEAVPITKLQDRPAKYKVLKEKTKMFSFEVND